MRANNNLILSALPASANQVSNPQWSDNIVRASFQFLATDSSAAGTLQAQGSNDHAVGLPPNQFVPANWNNIGSPVTVAGKGPYLIPAIECSYEYLRVTYTDTSSGMAIGTISIRMKSMAL